VYGSVAYNEVSEVEQEIYNCYNSPDCTFIPVDHVIVDNISPININGQYAEAYVYATSVFIYNGEVEEYHKEGWYYLQKTANDWKIYNFQDKQKNNLIELKNIFILRIDIP